MENERTTRSDALWWQPGLRMFWKLSGWIGGPVLVAVAVGKYLDARYHTEPWIFLCSVGIAFAVSMAMLVRIGRAEMARIERETTHTKQ